MVYGAFCDEFGVRYHGVCIVIEQVGLTGGDYGQVDDAWLKVVVPRRHVRGREGSREGGRRNWLRQVPLIGAGLLSLVRRRFRLLPAGAAAHILGQTLLLQLILYLNLAVAVTLGRLIGQHVLSVVNCLIGGPRAEHGILRFPWQHQSLVNPA